MADLPSGYQLRAARSLIGWSQADLAKASEVDHTTIARLEKAGPGQVLHRGVLRRLTPPLTHCTSARASRLAPHQFWQLSDIRRNPPRFIFCE